MAGRLDLLWNGSTCILAALLVLALVLGPTHLPVLLREFFDKAFWQQCLATLIGAGLGFWGALVLYRRQERTASERAEREAGERRVARDEQERAESRERERALNVRRIQLLRHCSIT
jgi:hypothetical protein